MVDMKTMSDANRGVWMTFMGRASKAQETALVGGGFVYDVRGGDPRFSTNGKSADGCLYTRVRTYVRRKDSTRLTAVDRRMVALVGSRPNIVTEISK